MASDWPLLALSGGEGRVHPSSQPAGQHREEEESLGAGERGAEGATAGLGGGQAGPAAGAWQGKVTTPHERSRYGEKLERMAASKDMEPPRQLEKPLCPLSNSVNFKGGPVCLDRVVNCSWIWFREILLCSVVFGVLWGRGESVYCSSASQESPSPFSACVGLALLLCQHSRNSPVTDGAAKNAPLWKERL